MNQNKVLYRYLLVFLTIFIASCGGGGGGDDSTPKQPNVCDNPTSTACLKITDADLDKVFSEMKELFNKSEELLGRKLEYLSMGMSDDYKLAIKNGSNMVRIGSKIFS